ncbi:MAG: DinB family protein [Acidithiobacillales bacterium]
MRKMREKTPDPSIGVLLHLLDEAFNKTGWHGPNLFGSVRRLSPEEASWRPSPERHSVQELVLHCAYWKYVVRRKLTGEKRGSFPLKGSNWFPRERPEALGAWSADRKLLFGEHRKLRAVVEGFPSRQLQKRPGKSRHTFLRLIAGIAAHDLYHTGQIRLLLKLAGG